MKIISKTYLLIGVLIAVAAINLFLLYYEGQIGSAQSYAIIRAGDLKVKAESVSNIATGIASGSIVDKSKLQTEIQDTEKYLKILESGGTLKGQEVAPAHQLDNSFADVKEAWQDYKDAVMKVEKTPLFDPEAVDAINYVLQKNNDLVLLTDSMMREFESLDRDYKRHKQISAELEESAKTIGQLTLLLSIGEGENIQEQLQQERLRFEIGIRKLLQIPTTSLDVASVNKEHETLEAIPRENSTSLRELDPLWESIKLRLGILEDRALLSPEYETAQNQMNQQKEMLFENIDILLDEWNDEISQQNRRAEIIIQGLLAADIVVFVIVLFVIRQSLNPLETITNALSRVKEGIYGEKIHYEKQDEVGELVKTFNIMSDTIKEKEEHARKTDIAKDEFLAMITHELKTPLVPIQGYTDILLGEHIGKLNTKQKERIKIIKQSSETLLDIISDLLDAQKLELGQLRMKKEQADISQTISKTIEGFIPQIETKGITINTSLPKTIVPHDPERISQVVSNLIKNSISAVSENTGKIDVNLENLGQEIKVSIIDNGRGIPKEKQKELFKKFYQVDASLTRERGGSGLGLAICKGIIESHGGKISAESEPGIGSTFSFRLPKDQYSNNHRTAI